jgi:hypothetical protein
MKVTHVYDKGMKAKLAPFVYYLILAPLAPIAGLLLFWWGAFAALPETTISYVAISGLLLGLLADAFFLKKLVARVHSLNNFFWLVILLFYSVGAFGFLMGVPLLNAALAIPAGFVVGSKLAHESADPALVRCISRRTCGLTTGLLALVCAASAFFALMSPSTPADLRGMLRLGFELTPAMIWGLILVGGAVLLVINWMLTTLTIHLTHRYLSTP